MDKEYKVVEASCPNMTHQLRVISTHESLDYTLVEARPFSNSRVLFTFVKYTR